MEKKYQVFVSSTYQDLIEERQHVIHALLELDCIPSGMELFPAADEDQWSLIKSVIDDCDYYLVIIGGRYGSTDSNGKSYTQLEYEYAISTGKPVIGFLHGRPKSLPLDKTEEMNEGRAKLEEFRSLVRKKLCKFWTTPDELRSMVAPSLIYLKKSRPARGWVRASLPTDKESTPQSDIKDLRFDESSGAARQCLEKALGVILSNASLDWPKSQRIKVNEDGYSIEIGKSALNVRFGQIESCEATDEHCVVALPANEFFDDECIQDKRSALGAYIQHAFPDRITEIRKLIVEQLKDSQPCQVEKIKGQLHNSFGIAKCVYLRGPLSSNRKIIMVSVTTKRAGQRLQTEPHFLFEAVKSITQVMSDHRLEELHLPLMGSGHGGLDKVLALLYMVYAVLEILHNPSKYELKSVNLVLFKSKEKVEPEIPKEIVERVLSLAVSTFR
ncbi:MAG: DUF4062 domain-containing protein [Pyrinomonadaceae bacterium]